MNNVNKKKVILVDLDDVLTDFVPAWCKAINKKFRTNVSEEDITDWNIENFFPTLTKKKIYGIIRHKRFWKSVKVKPDAIVYTKKLIDEGYEIFICTSTYYSEIKTKYLYIIQKNFPFINWSNVIIAHKKQMVKGNFLIDDGWHNVINGDYQGILFDTSHNRKFDAESNGVIRVRNWKEIYDIICSK